MKSITKQRSFNEVMQQLHYFSRIFIAGCGTCTTLTRTGGIEEVAAMKEQLQSQGKLITGSVVIPVACDDMTRALGKENNSSIHSSQALLVLACALGVQ